MAVGNFRWPVRMNPYGTSNKWFVAFVIMVMVAIGGVVLLLYLLYFSTLTIAAVYSGIIFSPRPIAP